MNYFMADCKGKSVLSQEKKLFDENLFAILIFRSANSLQLLSYGGVSVSAILCIHLDIYSGYISWLPDLAHCLQD